MFTDWMSFYNQARPAVGAGPVGGAPMFYDWGRTAASGVPMQVAQGSALHGPPAAFRGVPMQVSSPSMVGAPMSVAPSTMGVRVGEGVVQSAGRPQRFLPATITKEGVHLGGAPSSALQTITKEGVRVGEGAVQSAGRPAASGASRALELYRPAAAAAQGGRASILNQLRNLPANMKAGGWRALPTRGGGIAGIAGQIGGNFLDESQLLGGSESVANDTASKMLKWGGAGAAIGSMVPGVGTVLGGLGGAAVGAGHEFLERQGILGGPTREERVDEIVTEADALAAQYVPQSARDELWRQYQVTRAFAETPQEEEAAAQQYADGMEQVAMQAAVDPTAFMSEQELMDAAPVGAQMALPADQAAMAQTMFMQDLLARIAQPYADQYQQQANAAADSILATAPGGQAGALLRSQAEQFRANGSRDAYNTMAYALSLPAVNALQNQASMLNQLAQQQQQQAMGAVTSGSWQQFQQQQAAAGGGGDLNSALELLG